MNEMTSNGQTDRHTDTNKQTHTHTHTHTFSLFFFLSLFRHNHSNEQINSYICVYLALCTPRTYTVIIVHQHLKVNGT